MTAPEKSGRFVALGRVTRGTIARRYSLTVSRGWHGRAPGTETTLTHVPPESTDWILAYIPIAALDYQTVEESGAPRVARARAYAARSGRLPPGIAKYGRIYQGTWRPPRIRTGKGYVADGNHRVLAAMMRGDRAIRMYMPLLDYVALVRDAGRTTHIRGRLRGA